MTPRYTPETLEALAQSQQLPTGMYIGESTFEKRHIPLILHPQLANLNIGSGFGFASTSAQVQLGGEETSSWDTFLKEFREFGALKSLILWEFGKRELVLNKIHLTRVFNAISKLSINNLFLESSINLELARSLPHLQNLSRVTVHFIIPRNTVPKINSITRLSYSLCCETKVKEVHLENSSLCNIPI